MAYDFVSIDHFVFWYITYNGRHPYIYDVIHSAVQITINPIFRLNSFLLESLFFWCVNLAGMTWMLISWMFMLTRAHSIVLISSTSSIILAVKVDLERFSWNRIILFKVCFYLFSYPKHLKDEWLAGIVRTISVVLLLFLHIGKEELCNW